MLEYLKILDRTNARILEALGHHGPRNISELAKSIGLPATTVAFRIKKLMREGLLKMRAKLDYSKLGLVKAILIAESKLGRGKKLRQALDDSGFWTYIARCFGKFDGYYTIFAFPAEFKKKLVDYLDEVERLNVSARHVFYFTGNLVEVAPNFEWFDFENRSWDFQWDQWIGEIKDAPGILPPRLMDPKDYHIEVDNIDVLLLKELEKEGAAKFTELARVVNISPQGVRYRYNKHIMERELITDYEVATFPYPLSASDMCSFVVDFEDEKKLARFANSLQGKPFIISYGKIVGHDSLVVHTYTPKTEFSRLIDSLNRLIEGRLARNFFYVTLDASSFKRQTISYEFFKDNNWTYDHEKTLAKLKETVSK